jgi:hypothetical protein
MNRQTHYEKGRGGVGGNRAYPSKDTELGDEEGVENRGKKLYGAADYGRDDRDWPSPAVELV